MEVYSNVINLWLFIPGSAINIILSNCVYSGYCTKIQTRYFINNKHVLESGKSQVKALAESVSGKGCILAP